MTRLSQFLYSLCRNVGQKTPSYLYRDQVERINHINVVCTETVDGGEQGRRSVGKSVEWGTIGGKRRQVDAGSASLLGSGGRCKPTSGVRAR